MGKSCLTGLNSKALKKGDMVQEARPGKFRIYSMRFCPFAERTLLYLAKKGINTEVVNVNLTDKPDWIFTKHPDGKVPALEHDGKIVTESAIIPQYLDEIFPDTSILPKDPFARAQQKILAEQLNSLMGPCYSYFRADEAEKPSKVDALLKEMEKAEALLNGNYFFFFGGESAGYSDYMVYPFFERIAMYAKKNGIPGVDAKQFPGRAKFPNLTTWFANMENLPEVKATQQPSDLMMQYMDGYMKGNADYDLGL